MHGCAWDVAWSTDVFPRRLMRLWTNCLEASRVAATSHGRQVHSPVVSSRIYFTAETPPPCRHQHEDTQFPQAWETLAESSASRTSPHGGWITHPTSQRPFRAMQRPSVKVVLGGRHTLAAAEAVWAYNVEGRTGQSCLQHWHCATGHQAAQDTDTYEA